MVNLTEDCCASDGEEHRTNTEADRIVERGKEDRGILEHLECVCKVPELELTSTMNRAEGEVVEPRSMR